MRFYKHDVVKVTDKSALVCTVPQSISTVLVRNVGEATVYVGGADVTSTTGMPILTTDMPVGLPSFDSDVIEVYAVVAKGETGRLSYIVSS